MQTALVRALRILLYGIWAVILTATTYALGAVPLKVLRTLLGRWGYAAFSLVLVTSFFVIPNYAMGIALLSLVTLIGIFGELEDVGFGFMASAFFTLAINALLAAGAFAFWLSTAGSNWHATLVQFVSELQKPVAEKLPNLVINPVELLAVAPSVILGLWMSSLCLAVWLERRLLHKVPGYTPRFKPNPLRGFRLPDAVIWLFIVSVLGRFGDFGMPMLSMVSYNVMNVCLILFFFQGLAVGLKFFEMLRMPWVWQVLMVGVLVYLSLMVSFLGLMDYWLDFRSRFAKRAPTFNREV